MFSIFLSENRAVSMICGKYGTVRQATDDSITLRRKDAIWMLH